MSCSIKVCRYLGAPFAGYDEAHWLTNHFPTTHNEDQSSKIHVSKDDLKEHLGNARDCDATCEFFAEGLKPKERQARHDAITKMMAKELPKQIAQAQKEDKYNSGWVDFEVWW